MEYKLSILKNEKDIEEHFLNGEHDITICQDLFMEDSGKWVCQMQKNACNGNDGTFEFEFVNIYIGYQCILCKGYVWCDKKPYHSECEIELHADQITYMWNEE